MAKQTHLPDQAERDKIAGHLDATMLVEAAAGTGKTTWLIRRMVGLVRTGRCAIENLAAVTFTRKAAAELRTRFQLALESAAREPLQEDEQRRLIDAERQIERCFIGTIHAFCARLLRERPVEAGIPPDFMELDEAADEQLRRQAWHEHVAALIAGDDDILPELARLGLKISPSTRRSHALSTELDELGLEPAELGPAFLKLAEYPDIDDWPAPPVPLPDLQPCIDELRKYAEHIGKLDLPEDAGTDKLIPKYRLLLRMLRCADLQQPADLMEILEQFGNVKPTQYVWPGGKAQAKSEQLRWDTFKQTYAEPLLQTWREHRYEPALRAIRPAVAVYERLRRERRALNFQDLLLQSARLLREHPEVRAYFRGRFSHVLVDEFQDTDPIQAEVMLLLTATDVHEQRWQHCTPAPGSLFVVGDPKQSIYRFRRADIQTYQQVRKIIERCGGEVVSLTTNFRGVPPVIDWINGCFDQTFPPAATAFQPANRPMSAGRAETVSQLAPIVRLESPGDLKSNEAIAEWEADQIARTIRRAVDERWPVPRSKGELARGWPEHAVPGDFLIAARFRKRLTIYGRSLQQYGLPHVVTGGSLLNEVPELELLHLCLAAVVRSDDAIGLVALLRSELFGVSDVQLYELRRHGGRFSYQAELPTALASADAAIFRDAFERLQTYARWLNRIPAAAAIERIAADLGLIPRACAADQGDAHAGSFLKALELLRAADQSLTLGDHVALLGRLLRAEEVHDGALVRPPLEAPVRVMNLHQCKGLEAPFVFLVDPAGDADRKVDVHVDRSGIAPRGYVPIYGQKRGEKHHFRVPLLAQPPGWEPLASTEREFRDAEEARMRYVAATRAGVQLVISQRQGKRNDENPWQPFDALLADAPALADPGPIAAPPRPKPAIDTAAWQDAMPAIDARWQQIGRLSYDVQAIKAAALPSGWKPHSKEEHGAEWGNAVHTLLEAAMLRPDADLRPVAISVLEAEELPLTHLEEVLATIASVTASALWQRAQRASQRLLEVPISYLGPSTSTSVPTILRGVIDLAFREAGGWIIVDYKSERVPASDLPALVAYYLPQLEAYAAAWEAIVGEPVVERGVYFTALSSYVVV